ncbi:MAG: hypothetical protein RBU21_08865 [FCB group bacterium]|jgi:hypothetical protein|nr:hypothetical protein [FCB group bacterium]
MIKYVICALILAVLGLLFLGCSFRNKHFNPPIDHDAPYTLLVPQVDDYGRFWKADEAQKALDVVSEESRDTNVFVLLFAHGWHHNARQGDENLDSFKMTLSALDERLKGKMYADSRKLLTGTDKFKVVGIYVGWRGRSMPGILDYTTIWGRKEAAERVGSGDLREFILRLQSIYQERNSVANGPFLGLVLTGHSLGGQVLLKATAETIERNLIKETHGLASINDSEKITPESPIEGIGDLTVLLNPALESGQFERISELNSRLVCKNFQTPVMLVVSGEGDGARQIAFPISRVVTNPFGPVLKPEQRPLWYKALGEYEPQRTHSLTETSAPNSLTETSYLDIDTVMNTDFAAPITLGAGTLNGKAVAGGFLEPLEKDRGKIYSPIVVAYTSSKLIQGHSGIFTEQFSGFLTDYVAFIEGKRMLLRRIRGGADAQGAGLSVKPAASLSSPAGIRENH